MINLYLFFYLSFHVCKELFVFRIWNVKDCSINIDNVHVDTHNWSFYLNMDFYVVAFLFRNGLL